MGITWDTSSFDNGSKLVMEKMRREIQRPIREVALEIVRLSGFEVPLDTGRLQSTGHTEDTSGTAVLVGYNTPYAARLHEHPEYNFQRGRKGKYLEDPIKNNLATFKKIIEEGVKIILT
jgi:hypothetical protein